MIPNLLTLAIACASLLQAEAQKPSASEDGFEILFNGKTLAGWFGPTDGYEVKDGAISAKPGRGGTIYTRRTYGDFIVRFEYKLPPGGDGGLAIRYPGSGHPAYVGMCELQLIDHTAEKHKSLDPRARNGAAYGLAAPKADTLRPADWNTGELTVSGSTIKFILNGQLILDADLANITESMNNHPHPGKDRESGHFGLTSDGDPIQFRNIRLKRL